MTGWFSRLIGRKSRQAVWATLAPGKPVLPANVAADLGDEMGLEVGEIVIVTIQRTRKIWRSK